MKLYTRTGDAGTTALFGGARVPKHHPRIDAYGTLDELNATLGVALSALEGEPQAEAFAPLAAVLTRVQHDLFVAGADLATPLDAKPFVPRIDGDQVAALEADIDRFDGDVPPLRQFILPGGTPAAAHLHVSRTVCRRAERLTVEAGEREAFNPHVLVYLNRLSDLLFAAARWANHAAGRADVEWVAPSSKTP